MKKYHSLFLKGKPRHEVLMTIALYGGLEANREKEYRFLKLIILFLQNIIVLLLGFYT